LGTYNFTKFKNNTDYQENIRVPELIFFEITKKQGITIKKTNPNIIDFT